jgi:hypothetical protein
MINDATCPRKIETVDVSARAEKLAKLNLNAWYMRNGR